MNWCLFNIYLSFFLGDGV